MLVGRDADGREQWQGPFRIESVPSAGRYTLCMDNGQSVNNGAEVEEVYLEAAD